MKMFTFPNELEGIFQPAMLVDVTSRNRLSEHIPTSTVDPPTVHGGLSRLGAERISEDAGFLAGRSWR